MAQRNTYDNPPIEEALCEFRFNSGQEWNLTIPGKLHTELMQEYSGKPQNQRFFELEFQSGETGTTPKIRYGGGVEMVQLVNENKNRIIGIGKDVLSIHMLRPYQDPRHSESGGWEEFKKRISQALDAYWKVVIPIGVNRLGIRYINRIDVPDEQIKIGEYFKCALPVVDALPSSQKKFTSRVEYDYGDGVNLILTQSSASTSSERFEYFLDLNVVWTNTNSVGRDDTMEKVEDLRNRERIAFEAVITSKTRGLFSND